jgi:protein-tyrosine phosphatase
MNETRVAWIRNSVEKYVPYLLGAVRYINRYVKSLRIAYEQIRRPRVLPQPVRSILFICTGNLIRSPLAEAYLREKAGKEGHLITIDSAGLESIPGKSAHRLAKEIADQQGISLESHAVKPLYQKLIRESDLVLVMEIAHRDRVMKLYPQDRHKVFLLGQFCKSGSLDIADPYEGTKEDFEVCFGRIQESCDRVMQQLVGDRLSEVATAEQKSEAKEQDE